MPFISLELAHWPHLLTLFPLTGLRIHPESMAMGASLSLAQFILQSNQVTFSNRDVSLPFGTDAHVVHHLTFSGLALPHQECSSPVLQVQKEPLGVTPGDLPEIPPAKVDHRESVTSCRRTSGADGQKHSGGWKIGFYWRAEGNLFLHWHADVQQIRTENAAVFGLWEGKWR